MCPFFQAGLTGRHRTSRRPLAQNFENESSFQFFIVSGPIEMYSEFDLFSREVSVATRTIPSLSPELTLQPLRHPLVHCFLPHSTHTRFSHPSGWPLQAEIGSSTSSQGMIMDSILLSWTRSSTWCAQLFLINCPRGVSVVAVWSHGATGLGPAELRGACVRFVGL